MAIPPRTNRILARLPRSEFARVEPLLETVRLDLRQRLEVPNRTIQHVYFVDDGIVSVVANGPKRRAIEVGLIGCEGCSGLAHILVGGRSPLETYVQVAGTARRIAVADLDRLRAECPVLAAALLQAAYQFQVQVAYTALANGNAKLPQRLARWLLMAQDRLNVDDIKLTHDLLSIMLGVRRPGITVAVKSLREAGLVKSTRGVIRILDRAGLERKADKYYGAPEAELSRLESKTNSNVR